MRTCVYMSYRIYGFSVYDCMSRCVYELSLFVKIYECHKKYFILVNCMVNFLTVYRRRVGRKESL